MRLFHVRLNTDSCLRKLVPFFIVNTVICFSALKSSSEQVTLLIVVPSRAIFEYSVSE